jgi:transposase
MSRPFGSAAELERRRIRATEAVRGGERPVAAARIFGVNRSTIYRWLKLTEIPDGLQAVPHYGPAPRLSPMQFERLEKLLLQGAKKHGWPTELWTCVRVVELIRRHFGVSFHHDHVGRMLHERLNWSSQKPRRKARERKEKEIDYWKRETFPQIAQRARDRGAHLVFLDESGYMLTPTVRRTWAPKGKGAILDCWDRRDRLSAISCLTVSPKAGRLNLYFQLLSHNIKGPDVVNFLRELKTTLGCPFTVVWDRGAVHDKSGDVQMFLAEHPEIVTEKLPAYAPELNPDELVWNWTKYGRLANLAADNTDHLAEQVIDELIYLKQHPDLLASFVRKTELPLAA